MAMVYVPDEQLAALSAVAAREGISFENWLAQESYLDEPEDLSNVPLGQTIGEMFLENMRNVPEEIMAMMPTDGASQHDHYIYGWPKRDV